MIHCRFCNAEVTPHGKRLPPHRAGHIKEGRICEGVGRTVEAMRNQYTGARPAPKAVSPRTSKPPPRAIDEEGELELGDFPFGMSEHEYVAMERGVRRNYEAGLYDTEIARALKDDCPRISAKWVARWRKLHGLKRNYRPVGGYRGGVKGARRLTQAGIVLPAPKMIWDADYDPGDGWDDDDDDKVVPRDDDYDYGTEARDDEDP